MTKSMSQRITESRKLLQNQYAYMDDTGSFSALETGAVPLTSKIFASRRLLQDPYAYLDDHGEFTAQDESAQGSADENIHPDTQKSFKRLIANKRNKGRYAISDVEAKVTNLQRQMWQNRSQIWPGATPTNPIDILDPMVALKLVGYEFGLRESLGQYFADGKHFEVAGIIDDASRQVNISRQFSLEVRNFTAAHELGHAMLHVAHGLHRDRPLAGPSMSRELIEIEADKFASCFLMPQKLVVGSFQAIFGTNCFTINEETSFALTRGTSLNLDRDCKSLRDLSRILATTESYNGLRFTSLTSQFRVSAEAMAIRLEELALLAFS